MATTKWTQADLAILVEKALRIALTHAEYCEYCTVTPVYPGEKYCPACANEITEYLAVRYVEQSQVEKGLY